jgi:hypothetical protein
VVNEQIDNCQTMTYSKALEGRALAGLREMTVEIDFGPPMAHRLEGRVDLEYLLDCRRVA